MPPKYSPTMPNKVAPAPRADVAGYVKRYPHMHEREVEGLEELFVSWDDDGSGEMNMEEMAEVLERIVRDLFDRIDKNGNGVLSTKEIKRLMHMLGQNLTDKEFKEVMREMDKDNSGEVGFREFESWWQGTEEGGTETSAEELADLFSEVDADGSGEIDMDEFIEMICMKMDGQEKEGEGSQAKPRDAMQMVRMALQAVRDDVRAIYGVSQRPKTALQIMAEAEDEARNRRCFWGPTGRPACVRFRKYWDFVQVFVLIYIALAVPYRTGFGIDIPPYTFWFWWEAVCDVYFVFDIFLNFRTAYRTEEGELVIDPKEIRKNYLSSWFGIDVLACFPLTYIELIIASEGGMGAKLKAMKITRLLRLAKMLRLAKLIKIVKQIDENYAGVWTISKLSSLIMIILYVSHLFSCMWYFAGSENQILANGEQVYGWVHSLGFDPTVNYTEEGGAMWPADAWSTPYLDAYYYAITTLTTVGYGDRTPTTDLEKMFSIITELAGGITFGILAGTLSAMVTESGAADQRAEEQLEALKTFMVSKRVNKGLRRQIQDQMEYFYKTKSVFDEGEIVEKLPPKFKKTLLLVMYKPQLQTCPLFAGLDESIITRLATTLRPYLGVEGDKIVAEGEVGDEMYMVVAGDVRLASKEWQKFDGKSWGDGAFFGELPLLGMGGGELRNKHLYDVICTVESDLTFLTKSEMAELERDYPVFKAQVRKLAAKRAERFGIQLKRTTVMSNDGRRKMSVAIDSDELANDGVERSNAGGGAAAMQMAT